MTFLGMAPEQVREQADRCASATERISSLQQRLDGITRGVEWTGPDRERFLEQWTTGPHAGMSGVEELLTERADQLRREADQQDQASVANSDGGARGGTDLEGQPSSNLFEAAWDWVEDRAGDAKEWVDDRVDDAKEWVDDRVDDAKEWFGDWWNERFGDPLNPDRPWAEIHAEDIVDKLIEEDKLDHRTDVEVHGSRQITDSEAPEDLADLILQNDETRRTIPGSEPPRTYEPLDEAQVRVQKVTGADGVERYVVHVPPTQGAPMLVNHEVFGRDTKIPDVDRTLSGWDQQGQPFGWDNNLYAMAGKENAGANAVRAAMEEAGIPPGSEVAFVAHSQGGLVASQLADDPSFNGGQYQVTDVFSVGSPVQTYTPADPGTDVLNVQHVEHGDRKGDFVPALDLEGRSHQFPDGNPAPNVNDVTFGTPQPSEGFPAPDPNHQAHDSVLWDHEAGVHDPDSAYYGTVRNNADDPTLLAKDERMRGKYYGDGTTMEEDIVVDVSRAP